MVLAFGELASFDSTFLEVYFLFELMFRPKIFLMMILAVLLPLIAIVAFCYCCCRREKKTQLPKPQPVTK